MTTEHLKMILEALSEIQKAQELTQKKVEVFMNILDLQGRTIEKILKGNTDLINLIFKKK